MTGVGSETYQEVNPAKKDCYWANEIVSTNRMFWRRLANVDRGLVNREILYSMQPLDKVRDSFQDEEFKKSVEFIPLPILEAFVNAVVEELTQRPPKMELRATDPTAISQKEKDIELLKKRKILETEISRARNQIGEPPYKIPYERFNGNVQDFDKMGLDENDPEDVSFYSENFQRLLYEMGGQAVLDAVFKENQWDEALLLPETHEYEYGFCAGTV